jgi:hypothetical protein
MTAAWETCFAPGQHVVMSMVFDTSKALNECCPRCKHQDHAPQGDDSSSDSKLEEDIQWYAKIS